jgi:hypothetical protein
MHELTYQKLSPSYNLMRNYREEIGNRVSNQAVHGMGPSTISSVFMPDSSKAQTKMGSPK